MGRVERGSWQARGLRGGWEHGQAGPVLRDLSKENCFWYEVTQVEVNCVGRPVWVGVKKPQECPSWLGGWAHTQSTPESEHLGGGSCHREVWMPGDNSTAWGPFLLLCALPTQEKRAWPGLWESPIGLSWVAVQVSIWIQNPNVD